MILVSYDISDTKLRTQFSKLLESYGRRVQYSVFEIKNSKRILNLLLTEIDHRFKKRFSGTDSILIYRMCEACTAKVIKMGYAATEDDAIVFL
jgi:CRISPR-associated protein Cas2